MSVTKPKPIPHLREKDIARFLANLAPLSESTCLVWVGGKPTASGYGRTRVGKSKQKILAHRVAWVIAGRKITKKRPFILHNCPDGDNPLCCNVDHLWAGTIADNNADKA